MALEPNGRWLNSISVRPSLFILMRSNEHVRIEHIDIMNESYVIYSQKAFSLFKRFVIIFVNQNTQRVFLERTL